VFAHSSSLKLWLNYFILHQKLISCYLEKNLLGQHFKSGDEQAIMLANNTSHDIAKPL